MTRSRTTKSTIRARMAKTGERYTAARRHVLAAALPAPRTSGPIAAEPRGSRVPVAADPRGAVSDAKVKERTGHDLAHWFDVLDRFGGVEQGHTASARHLHDAHGVDGWYSQGITVAYERARGLRAVNQRMGGGYEVSITKMLDRDIDRVREAITGVRTNSGWARGLDPALVRALAAGVRGAGAKGFVAASKASYRCRFRWDGLPVEMLLSPRPTNRTQVVVVHTKLPSRTVLDARRAAWRVALQALAARMRAAD
jgi:hypothetical protein